MKVIGVCVLAAWMSMSALGAGASAYFEMAPMSGGYQVAKCEVTQKQYAEIMGDNPSEFVDPSRPVECVSWEDATAFCEKLTAREIAAGRLPQGWAYALPSDAQWDEFSAGTALKDAVTSLETRRESTEPAGASPANAFGLHDVIGNVWEWCEDWYTDAIRRKDANPDVPGGGLVLAGAEDPIFKVLRGGAWDTSSSDRFTFGTRLRYAPGMSNRRTGFRCILRPSNAGTPQR